MLEQILTILADGRFHSGEELGEQLGVSRAAIWKQLKKLDELDIPYSSVKGRGYRLHEDIELLNVEAINGQLSQRLDRLEVLLDIPSTNSYLFERAKDYMGQRYAVLAEKQSGGRGRRGRTWVSPFGKNIYLSLLVSLQGGLLALEGLSLVTAIAVEKALVRLGAQGIGLKWPNDVYADGKKLAGILLEVSGEYNSHCQVVIGVGLNLALSDEDAAAIDQPWAALKQLCPNVSRNQVAACLLDELLAAVESFQQQGFAPFQQYWTERDVFHQQPVTISSPNHQQQGTVYGVNRKGELMLKTDKGIEVITAGEVSVRTAG